MNNIRKSLLQAIFSGFNMRRWNDKLRPTELYEMDKQAHKMIIAFLICHTVHCKNEEQRTQLLLDIIEGSLFDYFYRTVITDLKPPLFYKIRKNKQHYKHLTEYVQNELETVLSTFQKSFFDNFLEYHTKEVKYSHPLTKDILKASHLFASQWEFNLIKNLNTFDNEVKEIEEDFTIKLNTLAEKKGMEEFKNILNTKHALGAFSHFCGQLRFQVRWSQEPRLPLTSVLGHLFFVATTAYFVSIDIGACKKRIVNNFFCGIFHDLPELLTRDIIKPVKNSSKKLPDFIKQYENEELESRIFQPLQQAGYASLVETLSYLLGMTINGEFHSCYTKNNEIHRCTPEELQELYNKDEFNPKDGEILKSCDILGAFMEARASIQYGVASHQLIEASMRIRQTMPNPLPNIINFNAILADFD